MKYLISIFVTFLAILYSFLLIEGSRAFVVFFNAPSLIIAVFFPIIFVSIINGITNTRMAFWIKRNKSASKEIFMKANFIIKMYCKILWLSSAMAVIIGTINFCANAEGIHEIGLNLAFALNSILYAIILTTIIIVPNTIYIEEKIRIME